MFCSWGDEFPLFSSTPITRKKTLSRLHGSIQVFKKRLRAPPHKWEIGKEPRNSSRRDRENCRLCLSCPVMSPTYPCLFICVFFHVHNSNISLPQTFSSISLRSSTKILSFSKRFPFSVLPVLTFFWHKTLSIIYHRNGPPLDICQRGWNIWIERHRGGPQRDSGGSTST